jgi:hypothetical protein
MKPGDLVRVRAPLRGGYIRNSGKLGVIVRRGRLGLLEVWWVLLEDGHQAGFEPSSLEVIA